MKLSEAIAAIETVRAQTGDVDLLMADGLPVERFAPAINGERVFVSDVPDEDDRPAEDGPMQDDVLMVGKFIGSLKVHVPTDVHAALGRIAISAMAD
jgi:hypothetical protein